MVDRGEIVAAEELGQFPSVELASMGVPVVLVYLGFLCAKGVSDLGEPFTDSADWSRVVLEYSRNIVPERAWDMT
jgi:hypothetical protein